MKSPVLCMAAASLFVSTLASATLTNTIAQVNASASELDEAGYTRVGLGPFVSNPTGACDVLGCVDLVGATGVLPITGYLQFRFNNYIYNPDYYNGLFAILNVDFSGSAITASSFVNQVNAQTGTTGVTAMFANQASDAQQTSFFNDWLPPGLQQAIVFKWMPATPPSGAGLSEIYTFAWDLTDATAFDGNGLTLNGAFALPAPGAIALVGLAGLAGRGRRRS